MVLGFIQFINEAQNVGTISGSGAQAARHLEKYVTPHITKSKSAAPTHTTAKAHGKIAAGASVKIRGTSEVNGVNHAHVEDEHGNKEHIPVSKLHKPGVKTENAGHKFENDFIDHLKKHGLMDKDAKGAGSTAGTDFHIINKKQATVHKGKVQSEQRLHGETKADTTAAMGQLTIRHDKTKGGWHIPDDARAKRPEYAKHIEKAGILEHMNKHHKNPLGVETTASGRAKSITMEHPDLKPGEAYLKDHHVDVLHVGSHGTYAVGKDKTGHGLPPISGKGKWTIREKQAGNKTSRTVMFQPHGKAGLNKSHVNLEHPDHIKEFKKTVGVK